MRFCNIDFNVRNKSELLKMSANNKLKLIITANAAFIVEANNSKRFSNILNNNYVTFDGTIPYVTARIFFYRNRQIKQMLRFDFEKLSGSDIVYDFCEFAKKGQHKIFFLGGKLESNQSAVSVIKELYNIEISGYSPDFEDYPFSQQFNKSCLEKINNFKPDILFVGFGAPKQEYWIDDHKAVLSEIGIKYAIGCGGTFDFVSQKIKRAPIFIQKIGLEGIWRFVQEPNMARLKRLVDSFRFFKYIRHKPDF